MLWGDLELKTDDLGKEYIEFHERATKTRQGATRDVRPFPPKMFATGGLCFKYYFTDMFQNLLHFMR